MVNTDAITLSNILSKACDVILPKRRTAKTSAPAALNTSQSSEPEIATLADIDIDIDIEIGTEADVFLGVDSEMDTLATAEPFSEMQEYLSNPGVTQIVERALYSLSSAVTHVSSAETEARIRVLLSAAPVQSVSKYLAGVAHYRVCEDTELVLAFSYLLRFIKAMPAGSSFSFAVIRRVYMTCVALACKFHQDNPFNSYSFGFLMGIPVAQMNTLEAALFSFFDFNLTPNAVDVREAHETLQTLMATHQIPRPTLT